MLAEVIFGVFSKDIESSQNLTVSVIDSHLFIDRMIVRVSGIATKNSEIGLFVFVCLFGLKFIVVVFDFEIIEEDDISHLEVESEIIFMVAPEVDLKRVLLTSGVYDFEFLSEVSAGFIAIGIGCVDNESDGGVESFWV